MEDMFCLGSSVAHDVAYPTIVIMEDHSQYYFSFFLWYRHSKYHRLEAEFYYFLALCGNVKRAESILNDEKYTYTGQNKIKLETWKAWLINHPKPSLIS